MLPVVPSRQGRKYGVCTRETHETHSDSRRVDIAKESSHEHKRVVR